MDKLRAMKRPISEITHTTPQPAIARVGEAMTIYYDCENEIQFESPPGYWHFETKVQFAPVRRSMTFNCLPRDWESKIHQDIENSYKQGWKDYIYKKQKLWGTYESWDIKITPHIRIYNLRVMRIDEIELVPQKKAVHRPTTK